MSIDLTAPTNLLVCSSCGHEAHEPGQCHGGINTTAGSCFCEAGKVPPFVDSTSPSDTFVPMPVQPLPVVTGYMKLSPMPPAWTNGVIAAAIRVVTAWDAKEFDERELCDSLDALKCKLS